MKHDDKVVRDTGRIIGVTEKALGSVVFHPQYTPMRAGKVTQTAAMDSVAGYATWGKLTTDRGVARIVGGAVIGENVMGMVAQITNGVQCLMDRVGETVDAMSTVAEKMDTQFSDISDLFRNMLGGVGCDMIGNLFSNIGKGNVLDTSIVRLVVIVSMVFGCFGRVNKIVGALLGAMIVGDNSKVA